jgi:hypothetical protein
VLNPNLHQSNRKYTEKSENSTSNPASGTTTIRARSIDQPAFSWCRPLLLAALPVPSRLQSFTRIVDRKGKMKIRFRFFGREREREKMERHKPQFIFL